MEIKSKISNYKIVDKLGSGGMGEVYKAEDTILNRPVAIKFLPDYYNCNEEFKKRFIREAQAASKLDHPNICTVHEINETDEGQLYIVFGYYKGETLDKKLSSGKIDFNEVLNITRQIAEGLRVAHQNRIIHRDIKPSNIIVTDNGIVKILDFGLAKIINQSKITRYDSATGTIAYMSPEQAKGEEVDERTDIWSLGVILYEMLMGNLPFKGEYEQAVIYSILNLQHPKVNVKNCNNKSIQDFVDKCISKDPDNRFKNATILISELEKLKSKKSIDKKIVVKRAIAVLFIIALTFLLVRYEIENSKINNQFEIIANNIKNGKYISALIQIEDLRNFTKDTLLLKNLEFQCVDPTKINLEPAYSIINTREINSNENIWYEVKQKNNLFYLPRGPQFLKISAAGYRDLQTTHHSNTSFLPQFKLMEKSDSNLMEIISTSSLGWLSSLNLYKYNTPEFYFLEDFYCDKYEITNEDYQKFILAGGYENKSLWKHEFIFNGNKINFESAVKKFTDQTGKLGPATWEYGTYRAGEGNYPVCGVSWYEAAAYAEYVEKNLPSIYHWDRIGNLEMADIIVNNNNINKNIIYPVGSFENGVINGIYDFAGNVREWNYNGFNNKRFILGAATGDQAYNYVEPELRDPFDRSEKNGFRCIKTKRKYEGKYFEPLQLTQSIDWNKETPYSKTEMNEWLKIFEPNNIKLTSKIELVKEYSYFSKLEKITINTNYDDQKLILYLFLPIGVKPPYQSVIIWTGAESLFIPSSNNGESLGNFCRGFWEFLIRDGRAVLFPVLFDTFERIENVSEGFEKRLIKSISSKSTMGKQVKDIIRVCDYIESREDLDNNKIAYYGISWGAHVGSIPCSIDERIKTGIFISGSIWTKTEFSFAHKVKIPVLLISGKYDSHFPFYETTLPYYKVLATNANDKKMKVFDSDHSLTGHKKEMRKEVLKWLDKYFNIPIKTKK